MNGCLGIFLRAKRAVKKINPGYKNTVYNPRMPPLTLPLLTDSEITSRHDRYRSIGAFHRTPMPCIPTGSIKESVLYDIVARSGE